MSIQTRTSARTKSKPQPYTPAKYENFSINKTRALDKKLEACNRAMDIKIEQKHQNYILELSAAAYEVLKGEIDIYFEQHSTYKLLPKHQHDNQGLCIRTSHSVRNRSNNRQLYRINLFHTTSKVEVNGQGKNVYKIQTKLLSNWNRAIEWSEDEPTPSQDTSAVNMSTIHNYCAICNQTAQPETSIDCIACSQLFHYTCENIDPVRISQTEEEQYSCRSCSIMDMDVVNISTRSNNSIIDTEEIERQKQLQQLTNQADNINQIDKEPTEEARLTINLTNSAAAKNDEVKAHTEVSHQVDVTPRTGLITTASSGDAPLEADCHQKFPSQRGANVGGPKHLKGLVQADNLEAKEDGNRKKPNHFLGSGRSNKIKGRISL
ncbi:unnamed protein product [Mytilus edulis]|uniref:PHD-type domain-containing protein n=1 Tax=Mytilus edulis TaxID=6550 RepID=A0A8S3RD48_MYTED|nr:unnamed protein product [Mytilus edulis]